MYESVYLHFGKKDRAAYVKKPFEPTVFAAGLLD